MHLSFPSRSTPVVRAGPTLFRQPLSETLLEIRRYGPPPFLIRNLRYVHESKQSFKGQVWDLEWAKSDYRSAHGQRHLVLSINPSHCIVSEASANRAILENPTPSSKIRFAFLHLCLFVQQKDGRQFSFNVRHTRIRVWVREHNNLSPVFDDVPFTARFDISSYLPLLSAPLTQISLGIRLSSTAHPPSPLQLKRLAFPPALVGNLLIWDSESSRHGTALPNLDIVVPLHLLLTAYPFDDYNSSQIPITDLEEGGTTSENSIHLSVNGEVQHNMDNAVQSAKPKILVTVEYTSSQVSWQGVVRHDFICPWCHRNCYRFRSLLSHLQVEHEDLKLSLEGMLSNLSNDDWSRVPFKIKLDVTHINTISRLSMSDPTGPKLKSRNLPNSVVRTNMEEGVADEVNYIDPSRYHSLVETARRSEDNAEMESEMQRVSLTNSMEADTASTVYDSSRKKPILSVLRENLWNFCVHCGRRHDRFYDNYENYCSNWCKAMHAKKSRDNDPDKPLFIFANQPRERKVNYKEAFGKTELFHIVSVSKMKEEHYDEDDPDSEEEVDQSWRLDLNIERTQNIKFVSAKEKVLWILWNRFAHNKYPIPSLYGERYTRYTLELFVLDHKAEIEELKLRPQFFGFVKALHVHGLIDSRAVLSIFQCLNGKKKRRDIAASARPELPTEKKNNAPSCSKRGRVSAMKKKGWPVS